MTPADMDLFAARLRERVAFNGRIISPPEPLTPHAAVRVAVAGVMGLAGMLAAVIMIGALT